MSGNGFLDRWSERKRKVAEEAEHVARAEAAPEAGEAQSGGDEAERTDAEILAELGLKDPDEMRMGDDFSVFMKAAIPARIRTRALRRLWASNPAFNVIDPLIDYGEDYTDAATVVENLQTSYEVGKGIARKVVEAMLDDSDITEKPTESVGFVAPAVTEPHSALDQGNDGSDESDVEAKQPKVETASHSEDPDPELVPIAKNNRRMRFHFEQDNRKAAPET